MLLSEHDVHDQSFTMPSPYLFYLHKLNIMVDKLWHLGRGTYAFQDSMPISGRYKARSGRYEQYQPHRFGEL